MNCGGTDIAAAKWCSWEDLGRAALGKVSAHNLMASACAWALLRSTAVILVPWLVARAGLWGASPNPNHGATAAVAEARGHGRTREVPSVSSAASPESCRVPREALINPYCLSLFRGLLQLSNFTACLFVFSSI